MVAFYYTNESTMSECLRSDTKQEVFTVNDCSSTLGTIRKEEKECQHGWSIAEIAFFLLCTHSLTFPLSSHRALAYSTAIFFACSSFSLPLQSPSHFPSHPSSNHEFWHPFPFWPFPTSISLFPVLIPGMLVPPCSFPVLACLVQGACQEHRS